MLLSPLLLTELTANIMNYVLLILMEIFMIILLVVFTIHKQFVKLVHNFIELSARVIVYALVIFR